MFNPDPDTQQPGTGHGGHVAMADPGELRLGIAARPPQLDITQDRGESFRLWKERVFRSSPKGDDLIKPDSMSVRPSVHTFFF